MLEKYPDLEARVPQLLAKNVKSVVVDCEAVAWDLEQHKILPFQVRASSCSAVWAIFLDSVDARRCPKAA